MFRRQYSFRCSCYKIFDADDVEVQYSLFAREQESKLKDVGRWLMYRGRLHSRKSIVSAANGKRSNTTL